MKIYTSIDKYREDRADTLSNGFFEPFNIQHMTELASDYGTYRDWWAQFYMSQLPGCCGVSVMHNLIVKENYRDLGVEEYFQKERETLCKDSGYSVIMATMVETDPKQLLMYLGRGFKKIYSFVNKRTNHLVHILVKNLGDEVE